MNRLAITSDLHRGDTSDEAIMAVVRQIGDFQPDLTILVGDLSESLRDVEACPNLFRALESTRSLILDRITVAGTIGWYDYSAADPAVCELRSRFVEEKRYFIPDAKRIHWAWSDWEFAAAVSRAFLMELDRLQANAAVKQIVAITYVPVLECQIPRRPGELTWGFSNACFGNLTLGQQLVARPKVTHVVSGHTHLSKDEQSTLVDGRSIRVQVIGCQVNRPGWISLDLAATH